MKKIMIVEDEAVIALRLEQRLIEMGYDVIGTICSGEAVVENARSFQPNLILMD
ncbi:MAG: response regulator, partial [Deltaproteobacteria bacterium]|nr:response regulator [Deltaproteobacteria bacterium]